eukprot:TRINITY_DN11246_c0_g1_i2.p1 TRINITY_DN11246_c0_g1~~TRINITY_DN11246_c0_g1_i2.p1  ORF type:complete len:112 (-),score=0.03 TRINITY_DN11246_c0_g1_i2:139-432(-)
METGFSRKDYSERKSPYLREGKDFQKKSFVCHICQFETFYDYFGQKPPFHPRVVFLEDCYVLKDPFTNFGSTNTAHGLCLGSRCAVCKKGRSFKMKP